MTAPTRPLATPDPEAVEWCDREGIDHVRLRGVLEWLDAHPEAYDQTVYARRTPCGTAACLGGWTVVLGGIELRWPLLDGAAVLRTLDGEWIPDAAQRLLGLNSRDADWLFGPDNTIDDLWRIAGEITHGAVRRLTP